MNKLLKILSIIALGASAIFAANNRLDIGGEQKFISGMNIAWINFARDVADDPIDENKMRTIIQDVRDAGGNALRWWL